VFHWPGSIQAVKESDRLASFPGMPDRSMIQVQQNLVQTLSYGVFRAEQYS